MMGAIKRAFHDEICWNALDKDEKADVLNPLSASRKADRETLADTLTMIAAKHGASVERLHSNANPGYCGHGIDLNIARNGGEWALISWFNDYEERHSCRDFTSHFQAAIGSGGNGRPHHKATSHPRDWYSLAMMLDGGLMLANRGEAFDEPSAA